MISTFIGSDTTPVYPVIFETVTVMVSPKVMAFSSGALSPAFGPQTILKEKEFHSYIYLSKYRGSNMNAHVLLNLLKKLGKRDISVLC